MVIGTEPHRSLSHCNVLYLGYSPPSAGVTGLSALDSPLRKAYPIHNGDELRGINSLITIYTSGIQLQLIGTSRPTVFWFPIQNLYITAANKLVNLVDKTTGQVQESRFVELNKPEAERSTHAPLFSFIMSQGSNQAMHCYTFMTRSNDMAMTLVEAAKHAYMNKAGHSTNTIPASVAAETVADDSDSEDGSSVSGHTLRVINVVNEDVDLFPERLVKRQKLENLRPQTSPPEREDPGGGFYIPSPSGPTPYGPTTYGRVPSVRAQPGPVPPIQIPTYPTLQSQGPRLPSPGSADLRSRTTYIRPPPIYIRAPPPRVVHIRHPPRIIRTPPQIIRQPMVIEKEVPVVKEVRNPTPPPQFIDRPYPVPVPGPAPEPQIVEVPVPVPPQIIREPPEIREVPVPVRAPTPPPQIIEREVPVYIEAPPRIIREPPEIREVPVPVPYEVQLPPPPPEIREVYIESPPVVIREPPEIEIEEIPVPVPYEVPVHVPMEVPRYFPVPINGGRLSPRHWQEPVYDDRFMMERMRGGPFTRSYYPPQVGELYVGISRRDDRYRRDDRRDDRRDNRRGDRRDDRWNGHWDDRQGERRRKERRSSSSSSSSDSEEYRDPAYGLGTRMAGVRLTEREGERRGRRRDSPQRDPFRQTREPEVVGYDFYRPTERVDKQRRSRKKRESPTRYRVQPRYRDSAFELERGAGSFDELDVRYDRHLPAHLSESVSELPRRHHYAQ